MHIPEPASSRIAERLRTARIKKNLSQSDLSLRAGLDRKTCYSIESLTGPCNTGVLTLEKLATVLEVSPAWLAYGEDDSQARIAGLLQELLQVKQARLTAAVESQPPAETVSCEEEEEDPEQLLAWPQGHRAFGLRFYHLPPLGRHYAPVLEALGPSLPESRRKEVALWVLWTLWPNWGDLQKEKMGILRGLLEYAVPAQHRPIVELVMKDLENPDQIVRGKMALSLIIDGGLPMRSEQMVKARSKQTPAPLRAALNDALEILESKESRASAERLNQLWALPAAHGV